MYACAARDAKRAAGVCNKGPQVALLHKETDRLRAGNEEAQAAP